MSHLVKKQHFTNLVLLALASSSSALAGMQQDSTSGCSSTQQKATSDLKGYYIGGFGGWGITNAFNVKQKGVAYYLSDQGGPLVVNAFGHSKRKGYGFGGLHFGYEWLSKKPRNWHLDPGLELEGFYFSQRQKAELDNPTERLDFHEFENTYPMRVGIIMANFTLALNNKYLVPYIGIGLGAQIVKIHDAYALQTEFPEPGINHYNTKPNAFNWDFATQAKAGLRYSPWKHIRFFAEYRFLFMAAQNYTFGNTVYPGHVATGDWNVRFGGICNNLFSAGIDFPW